MKEGYTFIYGTRPEAIKIKSTLAHLRTLDFSKHNVIFTGQQTNLASNFSVDLDLHADFTLNFSPEDYSLLSIFQNILSELIKLETSIYNTVIVQGDTLSALAGGFFAAFTKRRLFHIESGLRSYDKSEPYPEEINRQILDHISDVLFTPTREASKNLSKEGIPSTKVLHVGQSGIDILVNNFTRMSDKLETKELSIQNDLLHKRKEILVTVHRRENFENLTQICATLNKIILENDNYLITFILHSNPKISSEQIRNLIKHDRLILINPQDYSSMLDLIISSDFVLTDSGGIQEECAIINKPILVLRNSTERPEILNHKTRIIYSDFMKNLESNILNFLNTNNNSKEMNLDLLDNYGNGNAGKEIARFLIKESNEI